LAISIVLVTVLGCQIFTPVLSSPSRILEVTLSLDKEVYSAGDSFTFTIRVSNRGDEWIDIYYGKVHIKHSNLGWLFGDFTTEEFDIDIYLEPGETKEESITRTIPSQIPTWLDIFGDWEFTLILIDDEDNEYQSNTLRVRFR
jgi:hypothetical protein